MPDGRQINYLYYGSGHLHQINLDGEVISDIERDKLHREIQRTQGALTSRYELDPLGRLKKQIAALNSLSESGKAAVGAGYGQTAVKRSYGYDKTGNLLHSSDQRTGTTHFEYDKLGRITQAGDERFAFDPAHNILSDGRSGAVHDNRIREYNGSSYYHDDLGNLIHRELPDGEVQNYFYDLHDQLVKAEIFRKDGSKETWVYTYDALGRRIGKYCETSDGLKSEEREFVWDGSHLLQEKHSDGIYTYVYTDQDSYEPLAQIHNYTNTECESRQEINYFHCDQIGIPREMTDRDGNLIWFGDYKGWGKLKSETNVTNAHQPFRLQNQYCDRETRLHYNFLRYYEPNAGRFINQDPIRLLGGINLYTFAPNTQKWIDSLGLNKYMGKSCEWLKNKIDELINGSPGSSHKSGTKGLACRFKDQINGNEPPGSQGWKNHEGNIKGDQKALNNALDAWDKGGCGPRPPGATEWATKPLPTAADYKGNGGSVVNRDTVKNTAKVVAGVGVGYVIYRGIRMLPSLFPPLWPTIPANAAIP